MGRKSFTAVFARCDSDISSDGMAAVFNNSPSAAKSVRIVEIRTVARPINPDTGNALGNQGIISLSRISAASGGTLVSPAAHDTDAGGLPAQVEFRENPDSVTVGSDLRRFGDVISSYTLTKAIPFQAMVRAPNICDANDHSGRISESYNVWHESADTDTEPLVLREGEGFALVRREYGLPQAMHLGVTVRVVGTNRTYKWSEGDFGSALLKGMASLSLMNGVGSGVVLQVLVVSLPDLGEENIPSYRVVRVSGSVSVDFPGHPESVIPHDTANDVSEVVALRGPVQLLPAAGANGLQIDYWGYQGTPISTVMQQRADCFRSFLGAGPYITETGVVTMRPDVLSRSEYEVWPGDRRGAQSDCEIVLRPGQGIAVVGGGAGLIETSEQAYLDIEIAGYLEEPDAVYPSVGDVENGTLYGPSGTEYTGTLVVPDAGDVRSGVGYGSGGSALTGNVTLPLEADVKKDVQYGEGGTEFMGTLEGGTGGGKRRIRVVEDNRRWQ